MSDFDFYVSCLDNHGSKHEELVHLDSQDYKKYCAQNYSTLLQNYPPDQAAKHILATKKHYIAETIAHQVGEDTATEYDVAEMINTLDHEGKNF